MKFITLIVSTLKLFIKNNSIFICAIRFSHYLWNIKQTKTNNMKATVIRKEGNEVKEIKFSKVRIARGYMKDCEVLIKNGEVNGEISYTLVKGK
jgi:hypothetical protein